MVSVENKVNKLISEAKSSHYVTLLTTNNKSNPKKFWNIFNELIPKKNTPVSYNMKVNNVLVSDRLKSLMAIF